MSGLFPNLAVIQRGASEKKHRGKGRKAEIIPGRVAILLDDENEAFIHPSSLTHRYSMRYVVVVGVVCMLQW